MRRTAILLLLIQFFIPVESKAEENKKNIAEIFNELAAHPFHPLNDGNSMTVDKTLKKDGIADLNNTDWEVRTVAVRDLVREGKKQTAEIKKGLFHPSLYVRQVAAKALGILRATDAITELEEVVKNDSIAVVRSQAVIALGQMESRQSLSLLKKSAKEDPSKDVRHQCELAIYQIENQMGVTQKNLKAWQALDESTFETVKTGDVAPVFNLEDTDGKTWQLSSFNNKKWVALIWVFADWCPVCHGEFHDLIEMKEEFENEGVQVFTLEMHDMYRGRVMVGKELEPEYWFAEASYKEAYTKKIWWPHLLDRAGAYGAQFGADPMAFAVHAEYINRPTTVIIDPEGIVRFVYPGTFWGDRPTIDETLEMIKNEQFDFEHPKRLTKQ
ncbi:Peroxiredoxin [Tangfeifania diversioriginum]|uniref:Peroxiredoxin n=1 Tax=Tangfeifania diversioriginum TaxID=1168035 RepID=A0A1M6MRH2_9BACT|nr:HEAT repeat domain-containing protein [Tangfeifania diversioriginum]SHJ86057.1 Peroxiredoxin [Tangfeifania diversioriginum]